MPDAMERRSMARRLGSRQQPGSRTRPSGWATLPKTRRSRRTGSGRSALTEHQLHVSVAEMLDWMLKPPAMYTTFPAGVGKFSPALAGLLKKRGLKAGIPDILVFYHGRTLGIELKRPKGRQSEAQSEMSDKLKAAGVPVCVCHSVEEVFHELCAWRVPLRTIAHTTSLRPDGQDVPSGLPFGNG